MPPLGVKYPEKIAAFGKQLKYLREEKGLSQQALADIADIAKKTVQRIEQGKNTPSLDMLYALSEALDISITEMFNFE